MSRLMKHKMKNVNNQLHVGNLLAMPVLSEEEKQERISLCAYNKYEARGYEPGHEIQDWLDAEAEVLSDLGKSRGK